MLYSIVNHSRGWEKMLNWRAGMGVFGHSSCQPPTLCLWMRNIKFGDLIFLADSKHSDGKKSTFNRQISHRRSNAIAGPVPVWQQELMEYESTGRWYF
ncbi:hypothetical protein AAMO2058_000757900 [Amorphochlora amoebiformis]